MTDRTTKLFNKLIAQYNELYKKKHKSEALMRQLEALGFAIQSIEVLSEIEQYLGVNKINVITDLSDKPITKATLNTDRAANIPTLDLMLLDAWQKEYGTRPEIKPVDPIEEYVSIPENPEVQSTSKNKKEKIESIQLVSKTI